MDALLPQAYLIGLVVLLAGAAVVVARPILRVRRDELALSRFDGNGNKPSDAAGLYELASVQLRKRLYGQALDNLRLAARRSESDGEPAEARALIQNALGFALAAQSNHKSAIKHYRLALQAKPDYPVALNNLAFALEKLQKLEEAQLTYERVLQLEAGNKTARKRLKLLERKSGFNEAA
jgi:Flp pilus assembly protein TadD